MARTGRPREFDRDQALHAAMLLFWEQGFEPTSLIQLRRTMGDISPTSIYAAFGSKEALFLEAVALYRQTYGKVTDVLRSDSLLPRDAVETCLRQSAAMQVDASHPRGCLIAQSATNCSPENHPVAKALIHERHANYQAIRRQLNRAVSMGEIASHDAAEGMAVLFNTFLLGLSGAARDGASLKTLHAAIETLMSCWPKPSQNQRP